MPAKLILASSSNKWASVKNYVKMNVVIITCLYFDTQLV